MGNEKPRLSRGFHSSVGVVTHHPSKRIRLATIAATHSVLPSRISKIQSAEPAGQPHRISSVLNCQMSNLVRVPAILVCLRAGSAILVKIRLKRRFSESPVPANLEALYFASNQETTDPSG